MILPGCLQTEISRDGGPGGCPPSMPHGSRAGALAGCGAEPREAIFSGFITFLRSIYIYFGPHNSLTARPKHIIIVHIQSPPRRPHALQLSQARAVCENLRQCDANGAVGDVGLFASLDTPALTAHSLYPPLTLLRDWGLAILYQW